MYATMYVVLLKKLRSQPARQLRGTDSAAPGGGGGGSGARTLLPAGHDKLRPRDVTYELGSEGRRDTKKKLGG